MSTRRSGSSCSRRVPAANQRPAPIQANCDRMPPKFERPYPQQERSVHLGLHQPNYRHRQLPCFLPRHRSQGPPLEWQRPYRQQEPLLCFSQPEHQCFPLSSLPRRRHPMRQKDSRGEWMHRFGAFRYSRARRRDDGGSQRPCP